MCAVRQALFLLCLVTAVSVGKPSHTHLTPDLLLAAGNNTSSSSSSAYNNRCERHDLVISPFNQLSRLTTCFWTPAISPSVQWWPFIPSSCYVSAGNKSGRIKKKKNEQERKEKNKSRKWETWEAGSMIRGRFFSRTRIDVSLGITYVFLNSV